MSNADEMILGEFTRTLDERHRLSVPKELSTQLARDGGERFVLAKERAGCLSLWCENTWTTQLEQGVDLVRRKIQAGKLNNRVADVQLLGRLLSTRHRSVQLGGHGRLLIPEGFREFLGVEPGGTVMVVGAAVCIEIWRPDAWLDYLREQMPDFRRVFEDLAG